MFNYFFGWLSSLMTPLSNLWVWLTTPLTTTQGALQLFTMPISWLSIGAVGIVLVMKVIHILNPLS